MRDVARYTFIIGPDPGASAATMDVINVVAWRGWCWCRARDVERIAVQRCGPAITKIPIGERFVSTFLRLFDFPDLPNFYFYSGVPHYMHQYALTTRVARYCIHSFLGT